MTNASGLVLATNGTGILTQALQFALSQKSGVKSFAAYGSLIAGIYEVGKLAFDQITDSPQKENLDYRNWSNEDWVRIGIKVSIVFSALVAKPMQSTAKAALTRVGLMPLVEKIFGPWAKFSQNPLHPRHIFSLASAVLNLAILPQVNAVKGLEVREITDQPLKEIIKNEESREDTEPLAARKKKVKVTGINQAEKTLTVVNTVLSRPMLHYGFALLRRLA